MPATMRTVVSRQKPERFRLMGAAGSGDRSAKQTVPVQLRLRFFL